MDHTQTIDKELQELRDENASLQTLFNLQRRRVQGAQRLWRDCNPGNELVNPDLGKLVQWLVDERAAAKADTDRLDWICRHIPGSVARSLVGDMSCTGDLDEWRAKIDRAALAAHERTNE